MREYQTGMREERVLSKVVCNSLEGGGLFPCGKNMGVFFRAGWQAGCL